MNKLIATILLLAGFVLSGEPDTQTTISVSTVFDSIRGADSALRAEEGKEIKARLDEQHAKDSVLFANKIPDSLRSRIIQQNKEFEGRKAEIDSIRPFDTLKLTAMKIRIDSLRKTWEAKRDTQISRIKDTAVQSRIKAHIADITRIQAVVKARIEERKARLESTIASLKARIAQAKASAK